MNTPCPLSEFHPRVMMDSGAWSAYTLRKPLDPAQYCDFLDANRDWLDSYVALDFIAPDDTEHAAAVGFANYQYMRSRGLDPIPVFHQGEDIRWLHKYLDAGARYIGLSATSYARPAAMAQWYELAWAHLVNHDGLPIVRVHAFGDTREASLRRYPWASCDSISWLINALRLGRVTFDNADTGEIWTINHRNDGKTSPGEPDVQTLHDAERAQFDQLARQYGINPAVFDERISDARRGTYHRRKGPDIEIGRRTVVARGYLNVMFYQQLDRRIKALVPKRFFPRRGFFDNAATSTAPADPIYMERGFDLYLARGAGEIAVPVLLAARQPTILVSYWNSRDGSADMSEIKAYATAPHTLFPAESPARKYADSLADVLEAP